VPIAGVEFTPGSGLLDLAQDRTDFHGLDAGQGSDAVAGVLEELVAPYGL
jgi:hypothetical protein